MATFNTYNWNKVVAIQDPVYDSYLDKDAFFDIYLMLLQTFDGTDADAYVDLFFEPSPVNMSILIFVDEDAKSDFADLAIEMKLIPEIAETCAGESREDKLLRSLGLKSKDTLSASGKKKQTKQKLQLTFEEQAAKKIAGMQKEISRCRQLLEAETDFDEREKLNKNIHLLSTKVSDRDVTI